MELEEGVVAEEGEDVEDEVAEEVDVSGTIVLETVELLFLD